ncbi:hypothetical protein BH18THE1_BH18THE1_18790 [soil metagenome]
MPHKSSVVRTAFGKMEESIKMKPQNVILVFFFLLLAIPTMIGVAKGSDEYRSNIDMAVSYLIGKYDSHVGLLYESEDNGTHWLGPWATYRNTYWLYSDNLEALHVLKKYNPTIAENISKTYDRYEFPKKTLLFGTLFGENIPNVILDAENIAVVNNSESVIIYRRHQDERPYAYPYRQWSDTLSYRAFDEYQFGNKTKAKTILDEALQYWDGLGFNDHSTQKNGFYANYKIGLFVYVADKMNYPLSPTTRADMERQMWRQQNPETGGITSLADLNGKPIGSANVETTSLSLLPYTLHE